MEQRNMGFGYTFSIHKSVKERCPILSVDMEEKPFEREIKH